MRTPLMAVTIAIFGLVTVTHAQESAKPMLGDAGLDTTAQKPAIRPADDFCDYVNGAWLDRASIPADKFAWTRRLEMTDRVESRLHQMMESSAARNIDAWYTVFGVTPTDKLYIAPEARVHIW